MPKYALLFIPAFVFYYAYHTTGIFAEVSSNDYYNIQLDPLNIHASDSSNTPTTEKSSQQQNSTVQISYGFRGRATIPFTFSIDSDSISFGKISPTNPITRMSALSISPGDSIPYQLLAFEDHELANTKNGQLIPNTTCDDGTCKKDSAAVWNNPLTYGFGYRCETDSTPSCYGFSQSVQYMQFANEAKAELPQAVLQNNDTSHVIITYKVNTSGTQPAGKYQTTITYIATPSY